jgi:hemerythrin-like domain-containing protein
MTTPTDVLRHEHVQILRALEALERAAARLAAGEALPAGWWDELLDWLRDFADLNHHAKEEQALFPAMVKAGVPVEGGPVDVMLEEHERGRALIAAMRAGEPATRAGAARRYVALLREHIDKENGVLFPLAEAVLDDAAQRAAAQEFAAFEAAQGRTATLAWAEDAVGRLAAALG